METKDKKNQLPLGTWDKIDGTTEKLERVKFEINIPKTLVFICERPQELQGEDLNVYYSFDVEENKEHKILNTSAWSLLRGIKSCSQNGSLNGLVLRIVKTMVKGKQTFTVEKV